MSDGHSNVQLPPGVEMQDDEQINWGAIGKLAGLALFIFGLGTVFALFVLKETQGQLQMHNVTPSVLKACESDPNACAQVGIVEQRNMELEQRAQVMKKDADGRLGSYGWIDKEKQVVHIPVEEGMKKLLAGERP